MTLHQSPFQKLYQSCEFLKKLCVNDPLHRAIEDCFKLATRYPYVRHVAFAMIFSWLITHSSPVYAFSWNPLDWFQKKELPNAEFILGKIDERLVHPHIENLQRLNKVFDAGQETNYILNQVIESQNDENILGSVGLLNDRQHIDVYDFEMHPYLLQIKKRVYGQLIESKNLVISRQLDILYHLYEFARGVLNVLADMILGVMYLVLPFFFNFDWDTYLKLWFCILTLSVFQIVCFLYAGVISIALWGVSAGIAGAVSEIGGGVAAAFGIVSLAFAVSVPIVAIFTPYYMGKIYPLMVFNGIDEKYSTPSRATLCGSNYVSDMECWGQNVVEFSMFIIGMHPSILFAIKVTDGAFISIENTSRVRRVKVASVPKMQFLESLSSRR